ncbi:hypothetical protein NRIC_00400 [Enterococcus florum]|uniref:Transposase n=1 Tax=Enterococcus florum TaxID=2480627 RepID=A0A4V0WP02_9ENTE|nr:helix-turn-helix domain-containing protein [Enterococcus florum]GCF92149.1 hypothetical protein NRIC_00400 [Enterococcus florum]
MKCKKENCHGKANKDGTKNGKQRFRCKSCGHVFHKESRTRLTEEQRQDAIAYRFEGHTRKETSDRFGVSVRTIERLSNKAKENPIF